MKKKILIVLFLLCLPLVLPGMAKAGITISGPYLDTETHGSWQMKYGDCFYLIPSSQSFNEEIPITNSPAPYCSGGPKASVITWDIFKNNADPTVYAWYFDPGHPLTRTRPTNGTFPGDQFNPCKVAYIGATFENSSSANDPLTAELNIDFKGSLQVAYYFLEEEIVCRCLDYKLSINGSASKTGQVCDFDQGKYVVFNITGLTGPSTIKLEVENNYAPALAPACQNQTSPAQLAGSNTHLSGIFASQCEENRGEGCSQGYWKQEQHFCSWTGTGYSPSDLFNSVFGCTTQVCGNPTLLEALKLHGGGINALMRQAAAALLNAASPSVGYAYNKAGVIAMFQAAIASGDYEKTKDRFDRANEAFCPLSNCKPNHDRSRHEEDED